MNRPKRASSACWAALPPQAIVPVPNRAASLGKDETTHLDGQIAKNTAHVSDISSLKFAG